MNSRKAAVDLPLYSTNSIEIRRTGRDHLICDMIPVPNFIIRSLGLKAHMTCGRSNADKWQCT